MKKIFTSLFLIGISISTFAQIPTAGQVAYYPFNGNTNDQSGNNYNGTLYGATLTTDRFGNANSAYSFDGIDDYIEITDATALRLSGTDYTISSWVNEIYLVNTEHQAILSKRVPSSSNAGWQLFLDVLSNPMGKVGLKISGLTDPTAYSANEITLNNWVHIVEVFHLGTQVMETYINGVLDSTSTGIPSPNGATSQSLYIGSEKDANQYFFNGKIDDIIIYDRALTPAEITQVYSITDCNADIAIGLVAQYDFTGNANDQSTNANNGAVSGASLVADRFGNANSAYYYDGVNNYIEIPNISAYNNQLYTISYWTKFSTASTSGSGGFDVNPALISKLAPSASVTYDNWVFYEGNGTPGFAYGTAGYGGSAALFNDNNWHNIVCTVNNDSVRFYYDGVQTDVVAKGPNLTFNTQPIRIGRSMATYWKAFNGIIDDIRIYNIPLTACDIDSLFNMPNPTTVGITQLNNSENISVYPNPSNGQFTLHLNTKLNNATLSIYNILGESVFKSEINKETSEINLSSQPEGIYFLTIYNGTKVYNEKLIKQ